jgi:hypothetical protein
VSRQGWNHRRVIQLPCVLHSTHTDIRCVYLILSLFPTGYEPGCTLFSVTVPQDSIKSRLAASRPAATRQLLQDQRLQLPTTAYLRLRHMSYCYKGTADPSENRTKPIPVPLLGRATTTPERHKDCTGQRPDWKSTVPDNDRTGSETHRTGIMPALGLFRENYVDCRRER